MGRLPYEDVRKSFTPSMLWNTHMEILRLHVRGFKSVDIARMLKLTPNVVSYTVNSQLGRARVTDMQQRRDAAVASGDLTQELSKVQGEALDTILDTLRKEEISRADVARVGIAQDLLDRGGNSKIKKIQSSHLGLHASVSAEELEAIKKNGMEIARKSGLIHAEYEVSNADAEEKEAAA